MTQPIGQLPSRGLYFEELPPGLEVTSPARTITEADVVNFAALTGDWNPLHTDAEFAKEGPFGERVAHGLLGLSIASGLAVRLGFMEETVLAFRELTWKFRAPIKIGDTIRLRATVAKVKAIPRIGGGQVVFDVALLNQRDEKVQTGTWTVLVKGRPAEEAG